MRGHEIAVCFDTDCDGTSIAYFDREHDENQEIRYPYGAEPDAFISRETFNAEILPRLNDRDQGHWRKHGYWSDHSGIRNCEIARPVQPWSAGVLSHVA